LTWINAAERCYDIPTEASAMTHLPGAAFVAALAITVPVWAQAPLASQDLDRQELNQLNVVTPSTVPRPPPETAPGGTVVLRGSPPNSNASPPAPKRSGKGYGPVFTLPPGEEWDHNYDPTGFDRNYDTSFDRNYDTAGFDQRSDRNYDTAGFDRSGLTR
jgi:hypothetical protein